MKNIPERIWLNLGEEVNQDDDFRKYSHVTWSEEKIFDDDVEYVRKTEWISVEERLPDENSSNIERLEKNDEPKPAEPKFKLGDKIKIVKGGVFYERIGEVTDIDFAGQLAYYKTDRSYEWLKESDLESNLESDTSHETPVCENHSDNTSQKEVNVNSNLNLSQSSSNLDKQFDNILKDSFSKERRLNIAAMITQGIMANSNPQMFDMNVERVVDLAILTADTLIAESDRADK